MTARRLKMDIADAVSVHHGADFEVVYTDPPWAFKGNSLAKPGRNASRHYETMSLEAIEAIPVRGMVAKNAACAMWITPSFLAIGAHIPIMRAWGFKPSSVLFTWVKLKRGHVWHHAVTESDLHFGTGLTTRKQSECIVLGTRGRSLRVDGGVPEIILAPVREHSRKPDEAARRLLRYVGPNRRAVEMFSRYTSPGFVALGNETGKFDGVE